MDPILTQPTDLPEPAPLPPVSQPPSKQIRKLQLILILVAFFAILLVVPFLFPITHLLNDSKTIPSPTTEIKPSATVAVTQTPTPTCIPRPSCLDATPRCMIAQTSDMCPAPTKKPVVPQEGNPMCTLDAKLCPDGSYVSRSGPNCEFSTCP